ncbi:hypothetical protein STVIR_1454 [Streptomyces viridochromogenes Tue57]|uniref:Uncharacterized protein n=1 Tax=Streptomyces viridochromogenes Tue57 TaxID=1160705 RepID=L8PNI6_STRVR|nr:hypothetical protein STVIR_1454 [Streptomyces viridochromogenes Tue57]
MNPGGFGSPGGKVDAASTASVPARWGGSGVREPDRWFTAPAAEANRSSNESGTVVGPVSSVESSYSCPHQSSS